MDISLLPPPPTEGKGTIQPTLHKQTQRKQESTGQELGTKTNLIGFLVQLGVR